MKKHTRFQAVVTLATAVLFTGFAVLPQAPLAFAQDAGRRIALFVLPSSEADVEASLLIGRMMRQFGTELSEVDLITPAPIANRAAVPQVVAQVEEAYKLLNTKKIEQAMAVLKEVQPLFEQVLAGLSVRTVALYYKSWGVGQALSGNSAGARSALELSLALWPDQSNLEYVYSVEVLNLFTSLQKEIANRPSGDLEVRTIPENAVVTVDQREPEQTPATVKNLVAGPHLVKISLDGYEQWAGMIQVSARSTKVHEVTLTPIPDKATFDKRLVAVAQVLGGDGAQVQGPMIELQTFMGVDDLLVVAVGVVGMAYELKGHYLKADGALVDTSRTLQRDAEFYAAVKEYLSGTFEAFFGLQARAEGLGGPPIDPALLQKAGITTDSGSSVFDPDNPVFPEVKGLEKKKKKVTQEWWFWTAIGVVVTGAVVGGVFLFTNDSGSGGPSGTLNINMH
ncbi:MAG: PEGA domain-containing protein [Deltaproteobacteria bacterium]|nr:PEGA domain-containing protein [Deltaproteobacteria bacterium]